LNINEKARIVFNRGAARIPSLSLAEIQIPKNRYDLFLSPSFIAQQKPFLQFIYFDNKL
jgi:hypothetical protein